MASSHHGTITATTQSSAVPRSAWLTWPNAVTVVRLLLTLPLCAYLLTADGSSGAVPVAVLVSTVLWAGSDWLDGFLARRLDQRTRVGEVLDPLADRTGVLAVSLSLALTGHLPWWVVAAIAGTDLVVALVAGPAARRGRLRVSRLGKLRTALLLGGLCLVLAGVLLPVPVADTGRAVLAGAALMHLLAGADYVRTARAAGPALAD